MFTVPKAHKFKQNKARNTDTDYEQINTKRQHLLVEINHLKLALS